jgi:pilus assembly protein CpaB
VKASRLNLIIALVLAVAAGFSVWVYTAGAKTAVQKTEEVQQVLVAKKVIPVGTTLTEANTQGLIGIDTYPVASLPAGYLKADDVRDAAVADKQVAQASVPAGTILGSNYFITVTDSKPNVGPLQVPAGMFAVSVATPDSDHVGTFIVPGVEVAVFCTYTDLQSGSSSTNTSSAQTADALKTRLLVDQATVIAVGAATTVGQANAAATAGKNANGLITLAANQGNAQKIIHCTRDGQVYLSLLGNGTAPTPDNGVSSENLFKN